jgi:hypothetical protein
LSKYTSISCFRGLRTPGCRQTDRTVRAVPIHDVERGRVLAAGDGLPYQINYMPIRKSPTAFTVNRSFVLPCYTDRASGCSVNLTRMPLAVETRTVKRPASQPDNYLHAVHIRGVDTAAWGQCSDPIQINVMSVISGRFQ